MTANNVIESPRERRAALAARIAVLPGAIGLAILLSSNFAGAQVVSRIPLSTGGNVPGNLLLTPSVEFPTMDSVWRTSAVTMPRAPTSATSIRTSATTTTSTP